MSENGALIVGLLCTAAEDDRGSMRAYASTLVDALSRYQPEIQTRLVELANGGHADKVSRRTETLALPWRAFRKRGFSPDIWHILDGSRAYAAIGLAGARFLVTEHDIIPWLQANGNFPGAPPVGLVARQLLRLNRWATRRALVAVCVSQNTSKDLTRSFGVAARRCRTIKLPLRANLVPRLARATPAMRDVGCIIHVGNNRFYKNRAQVLRLFARMNPGVARSLVMLGPTPPPDVVALAKSLNISDRVRWILDPGDEELVHWYSSARVMLFPSLYEGYGWPVLEAMAFGCPVVSSDRGSLPEVVGPGGSCLPLDDEESWIRVTEELLSNAGLWDDAQMLGFANAARVSTEDFAEQMAAVYRAAVRQARG